MMNSPKLSLSSKPYLKLLRISIAIGLVISLTLPVRVYAEDTEDLLNIYGMTLGKPDTSEIEKEMQSIEQDILGMQAQQAINEEYNAIMKLYIEKKQATMDTVLDNISTYQDNNSKIESYISNNILDADIDTILKYDSSYKSNTNSINDLLSVLNEFSVDEDFKNVDFDTSNLEAQLVDAKVLYADAIDTYDLGDVTNIKWVMPNERKVNSRFGYRVDPLDSSVIRYHSGTDYRAPEGTPIGALFNGVVSSCGWSDTCGYYVTVQCGDNIKYFICHCSELLVEEGQIVKQYDTLALSGGTGTRSTGPHLHMAIYINGCAYDVDVLYQQ